MKVSTLKSVFVLCLTLCVLNSWGTSKKIQSTSKTDLYASSLKCEYKENPVTDATEPRLSWILNSAQRGQLQTSYQILVASSPSILNQEKADLWNSGEVKTNQSSQIVYKGKPLHSREICYWKVRCRDKNRIWGPWSKSNYWEMGLLHSTEWKAKWIGLDLTTLGKGKVYHLPPVPYLRHEITLSKEVKKARLYVTALGLYEFSINGEKVGEDLLTPGWTDYNKRVYYQTYNVTPLLRSGENALSAMTSYGWYAGYIGYALLVGNPVVKAFYGKVPVLKAQLEVEYTDGKKETFCTDQQWKANYGPLLESDILEGETYNAQAEFNGWQLPNFNDMAWKPAEVYALPTRKIECHPGNPVQVTQTIIPISITSRPNGQYIFNMGQNFAGVVKLKVKGNAGDTITIRYGEMLHSDGSLMTENLRMARATDRYILKGNPHGEEWTPKFTFHGFQYVEVSGLRNSPDKETITGLVVGSNTPVSGTFTCSSPMINQLYSNITWTQRSNFIDIPTDCPQRDERLGWTADAQVYVKSAIYNRDLAAFYTKWVTDLNDAQNANGTYPDYAPAPSLRSTDTFSPGWMEAGIICPYQVYKSYGDTRLIEKGWPYMTQFMKFHENRSKGKFLYPECSFEDIDPKGGYGDWLSIGPKTSPDMLATFYYGYCASLMAEMAKATGKTADAAHYSREFENIKKAFQSYYVDPSGIFKCNAKAYGNGNGYVDGQIGFSGDTQTAYANAIYMNMLNPELRSKAANNLVRLIHQNGDKLATGFLGVKPLLPSLSATNNSELAYKLLLNKEYPSWGYEVENGATSIWERWNSYSKENGNIGGMNSFSHYSFGSVCEWLFENMAGIRNDGIAYNHFSIKPEIPQQGISSAQASLLTIHGKISSSWKKEGTSLFLNVSIPANTIATIYIPAKDIKSVLESGNSISLIHEIHLSPIKNGILVIQAGSGSYSFESRNF